MKRFFILVMNIVVPCIWAMEYTGGQEEIIPTFYITPHITNNTNIALELYSKEGLNPTRKIANIPAHAQNLVLDPIQSPGVLNLSITNDIDDNAVHIKVTQLKLSHKTSYTIFQPVGSVYGSTPPPTSKDIHHLGTYNVLNITINGTNTIQSGTATLTIKGGPKTEKPGKKG